MLVLDVLYVASYAMTFRAYDLAPNDASYAPADDVTYVVTSWVTANMSFLRNVVILLAVIVVALHVRRARRWGACRAGLTVLAALGVAALAAEVVRWRASSHESHPTSATMYLTIAAVVLNAGVVVAVAVVFAKHGSRRADTSMLSAPRPIRNP